MNSGHFHPRTATVTFQLSVCQMFSHQVFSIKPRLMTLFSFCIACLGSVKTICWEGGRKRGAFCRYRARHSAGGEEMTPEQIDSGKSLCHRSLEHLNSRHNSLRSRLSDWSHRSAVTKGDKSNGDDGGVSWYARSACSVPLLVDLFQTPTAGSPGTTGTVWHFLTWGHFSESLRATDSSEPRVQRWLMGSQRAVVEQRK